MKKLIQVDQIVYAKLLEKKSQLISTQGKNITFSDLIGTLLEAK